MVVKLTLEGAKFIIITDEHAASFCGVPVAVVDGEAYGPSAILPIWPSDDLLAFLHVPATVTVDSAISKNNLTAYEIEFIRRFCENV